jgi:YegS/Rv2252/BmrU family lipid kinase
MKKIAFIVNPVSGTAKKDALLSHLKGIFTRSRGYESSFYKTKGAGDAYAAAVGFKNEKYDIVVAVGGDGTVNQVARALVNSETVLGIIPMGSGNGLARHLRLPRFQNRAIDVILRGKAQYIDAGKINDEIFFCTAGIGFEAVIGERFNSAGSRGLITYLEQCAKEYVNYRREEYKISIPGYEYRTKAFLITFANSSQWGNNVYIAPDADITDGMIDMVIWKRALLANMPLITAGLLMKTIQYSEFVDTFRCKEITISRQSESLIQFDGESRRMGKELHISVIPKAVKVLVPDEFNLVTYAKNIAPRLMEHLSALENIS